jgi:hypothetical protein
MGKRKNKSAQQDLQGPSSQPKKKKQKKKTPKAAAAAENTQKRGHSNRHAVPAGAKYKNKFKGLKPVPPQSTKKKGNQKAAKKAPAKKVPRIRLPAQRIILKKVPWMKKSGTSREVVDLTEECNDKKVIDLTQSPRRARDKLPTDGCDPELMEQFSNELRAFAEYVRLTDKEKEAREAILQQMHEVAVRQFQNSPEINVSDLELQGTHVSNTKRT